MAPVIPGLRTDLAIPRLAAPVPSVLSFFLSSRKIPEGLSRARAMSHQAASNADQGPGTRSGAADASPYQEEDTDYGNRPNKRRRIALACSNCRHRKSRVSVVRLPILVPMHLWRS